MNDAAAQSCLYEQAAQGSGRITAPGGVQENGRYGIWERG